MQITTCRFLACCLVLYAAIFGPTQAADTYPTRPIRLLVPYAIGGNADIHFGSNGNGSPANLAGALLNLMAGINLVHVAYKGTAQATNDVLAGHIPLAFPSMTSVLPHVKAGKLRALAITSPQRSALAPELPTVAESGVPGYHAGIWVGLLLPAAAPRNIVGRLNAELGKVLSSTETRERFGGMGAEVLYSSPADFDAFMRSEIAKWAKVIKEAGIRVDLAR